MNPGDIDYLQVMTDVLGAFAIAMARQLDGDRFIADLRLLAGEAHAAGHGPTAGMLDEMIRTLAYQRGRASEH